MSFISCMISLALVDTSSWTIGLVFLLKLQLKVSSDTRWRMMTSFFIQFTNLLPHSVFRWCVCIEHDTALTILLHLLLFCSYFWIILIVSSLTIDFFAGHGGIQPEIIVLDALAAYWQKSEQVEIQHWRYAQSKFKPNDVEVTIGKK